MTHHLPLLPRLSSLAGLALRLSLCLALTLAGIWSAQACAAREGLTQMVICSSAGDSDVIWLDARGHAAPAPADCDSCPDCLAAATGAVVPGQFSALRSADPRFEPHWISARAELPERPDPAPAARGPPWAAPVRMIF